MMMTWQKWRRMQESLRVHLKNPSLPQQPISTSPHYHFVPPIPGWLEFTVINTQISYPSRVVKGCTGMKLLQQVMVMPARVNSVAFFPDGRLASGSDDKTVRVWDSKTGNAASAPLIEHTELVWSVAVSPDGKLIASGSKDKTLRIWDSDTGACPLGPISAQQ